MAQPQWLDQYSGETAEQLIALEGKCRTDSLVHAFEQAIDQKAARVGEAKLTEEERIVLAVEALENLVNNGGYVEFFRSASQYASIIVHALQRIGCPVAAEITRRALALSHRYPVTPEQTARGAWKSDEAYVEASGQCDRLYFKNEESIEERLFAFVKANRQKISL